MYPTPFTMGRDGFRPLFYAERNQLAWAQAIMDKDGWQEKINDPEIISKWKQEAIEQVGEGGELTHRQARETLEANFDNMIEYLKENIEVERATGIQPAAVECIWMKRELIPSELAHELRTLLCSILETKPKDFHPGSKECVVDLVHPSVYCWVKSVTELSDPKFSGRFPLHFTTNEEAATTDASPAQEQASVSTSQNFMVDSHFQWLPTEFVVYSSADLAGRHTGEIPRVDIKGYINNLHPIREAALYPVIGKIFGLMLPLFERCLAEATEFYDEDAYFEVVSEQEDEDSDEVGSKDPNIMPETMVKRLRSRSTKPSGSLRNLPLQVITKIQYTELTPERPEYEGANWHIEATEREAIVATGIYYYEMENVEENLLNFERPTTTPKCRQNRGYSSIQQLFGLENEKSAVQRLPGIKTKEGMCMAFPNMYPHEVSPIRLKDPTKPGYRKILVFFLVRPDRRIPGTDVIAPQQIEWYEGEGGLPGKPPANAFDYRAACCYREELMEERGVVRTEFAKRLTKHKISLCEH